MTSPEGFVLNTGVCTRNRIQRACTKSKTQRTSVRCVLVLSCSPWAAPPVVFVLVSHGLPASCGMVRSSPQAPSARLLVPRVWCGSRVPTYISACNVRVLAMRFSVVLRPFFLRAVPRVGLERCHAPRQALMCSTEENHKSYLINFRS